MINIICSGKIKEKYLNELINDYTKRISKYHKIQIIEIKDENDYEKEVPKILENIKPRDYVIACDIEGIMVSSEELSLKLDKIFMENSTIDFIIGSSNGLSNIIKEKADMRLSFSKMTMPHGLFRGILLEQIYRSFKILNNESYHK